MDLIMFNTSSSLSSDTSCCQLVLGLFRVKQTFRLQQETEEEKKLQNLNKVSSKTQEASPKEKTRN